MINDTARLANDLNVIMSTLSPDIDMQVLPVRLEEVLANYEIHRKSEKEIENDLQEKIDIFIAARKIEGLSDDTIIGYQVQLSMFARYINKAVVQITTSDIRKYLAHNKKWMMSTVDNKLSKLKSFFGWLVEEEMLLRNPASKIKPPKLPRRLARAISLEELEVVRDACKTLRERALIEVMYSTGCRLAEIRDMKISDINQQEMKMRVIGKGDAERIVYLSIKSMHQLKKYLLSRGDDCEYLFITDRKPLRQMVSKSIERIVAKIASRIKISKKLTPHVFRHTFGTVAAEAGMPLAELQSIMGHSNPSTTLRYTNNSEERKKQAHKRYHVQ
jgi:site-specific recombinase XerD